MAVPQEKYTVGNYKYGSYLEKGSIVLTFNKRNLFSKLIYLFSRKKETDPKVSHAMVHLGNGFIIEASFYKGVKLNHIKNYSERRYIIYVCKIAGLDINKAFEYAVDSLDAPYAYLQILVLFFKRVFKLRTAKDMQKNSQICSEFVANFCISGGVQVCDKNPALTTPIDILSSENVEIVYCSES